MNITLLNTCNKKNRFTPCVIFKDYIAYDIYDCYYVVAAPHGKSYIASPHQKIGTTHPPVKLFKSIDGVPAGPINFLWAERVEFYFLVKFQLGPPRQLYPAFIMDSRVPWWRMTCRNDGSYNIHARWNLVRVVASNYVTHGADFIPFL